MKNVPLWINVASLCLLLTQFSLAAETSLLDVNESQKLTLQQQLGKQIFFDSNLSTPAGQSCASCHDSKVAFTEPNQNLPVSTGALTDRAGSRNTPSAGYAAFSPKFHFDEQEGLYIGGQFLDGRADNLTEQAKLPFLNADEMNNADAEELINKVRVAQYNDLFKLVYGQNALEDSTQAFQHVAEAIAAFENSSSFNRFSSKYDYFLAGKVQLSTEEALGLMLFEDENKGNCAACHISQPDERSAALFTDFSYDNLGVPSNLKILALKGADFVDIGLGETVADEAENGKFKVPSLRNIALTAPYMHNGVFDNLRAVVDFYNTRDTDPKWPAAEVAENVNDEELGDLQLSSDEVDAIVAFMRTLTDGYTLTEQPVFNPQTGALKLPLVKLQDDTSGSEFFTVELQQIATSKRFRLTQMQALDQLNNLTPEQGATFMQSNALLEIPLVKVQSNMPMETVAYVAQLKLISTTSQPIFELIYLKRYQ